MTERFLQAPCFHHHTLASTSATARQMLLAVDQQVVPFVVSADLQTAGRGRGSNRWYSDAGSLGLTIAFDPVARGLSPEREPCLSLAFGAILIRHLERSGQIPPYAAGMRWPNDLEAGGLKFGGLLPERIQTSQGPRILLGIGLNIHTNLNAAPPEVARMATSLARLQAGNGPEPRASDTQTISGLAEYRVLVLETLDEAIHRLASQDQELPALWSSLDLLLDQPVRIQLPDRLVEGVGAGIDEWGRIRVRTEATVETLSGGSVLRN